MAKPKAASMVDIYGPSVALLAKLGSIIVHADEASGAGGHAFDWQEFRTRLADPEVQAWLEGMRNVGLLPVKRT